MTRQTRSEKPPCLFKQEAYVPGTIISFSRTPALFGQFFRSARTKCATKKNNQRTTINTYSTYYSVYNTYTWNQVFFTKKTRKNYKDLLIVNSAPKSRGFFTVVRLYTVPFSEIVNSTFRFGEVVKIVDLTTRFGAVFRYRKSYGAVRCFDT